MYLRILESYQLKVKFGFVCGLLGMRGLSENRPLAMGRSRRRTRAASAWERAVAALKRGVETVAERKYAADVNCVVDSGKSFNSFFVGEAVDDTDAVGQAEYEHEYFGGSLSFMSDGPTIASISDVLALVAEVGDLVIGLSARLDILGMYDAKRKGEDVVQEPLRFSEGSIASEEVPKRPEQVIAGLPLLQVQVLRTFVHLSDESCSTFKRGGSRFRSERA